MLLVLPRAHDEVLGLGAAHAVEGPHVLGGVLLGGDEALQAGDRRGLLGGVVGDPLRGGVEEGDVLLHRLVGGGLGAALTAAPGSPALGGRAATVAVRGSRRRPAAAGLHPRHLGGGGRVGESGGRQEVVERLLDDRHEVVVVGARQEGALGGGFQDQRLALGVGELQPIEVGGEGGGEVLGVGPRPGTLGPGVGGGELPHVPLVGGVGAVQAGDRAPAHGSGHGIGQGLAVGVSGGSPQDGQVGGEQLAVPGGSGDGALRPSPAVPEDIDLRGVAGYGGGVVAPVAHGGLEVGDAPGRVAGVGLGVGVLAAQTGVDVDEAGLHVGLDGVVGVLGGRLLGGVSRGVDREDGGCGGSGEAADGARGVDGDRVGAISVVLAGEVGTGHVDAQGLVVRGLGRGHVAQTQLVVDLVVGVVAPGGGVQGEFGIGGSLRRGRGGGLRGGFSGGAGSQAQKSRRGGQGGKEGASWQVHRGSLRHAQSRASLGCLRTRLAHHLKARTIPGRGCAACVSRYPRTGERVSLQTRLARRRRRPRVKGGTVVGLRDSPEAQSSAALGWVMSMGTTHLSNSSAVTKPSSRADSRRDRPLWCAFLAILEALS